MKKITLIILSILAVNTYGQDVSICRNIANLTFESINQHSSANIIPYLANDFEIANQKGEIAKLVITQLFSQLDDTVTVFEEIKMDTSNSEITLIYNTEYTKKGNSQTTFKFNENNQLKELSLFATMQVKTLSDHSQIQKDVGDVVKIPFVLKNKLIAVDVLVNGKKRKFLVDSGSSRIVMNSKYYSEQNSTISSPSVGINGRNISGDVDIVEIASVDFYGIKIKNQRLVCRNLSHIEDILKTEIYGLIGFEILKHFDVVLDYQNQELTLINPDNFDHYRQKYHNKNSISVPFEMQGHIPLINAQIADKSFYLGLDTGAEANLLNYNYYTSIKHQLTRRKKSKLTGINKSSKVYKAKVKKLLIGSKVFKKTLAIFSDISHLNGNDAKIDGLLGYPILSKQKTIISYKRKELIFVDE